MQSTSVSHLPSPLSGKRADGDKSDINELACILQWCHGAQWQPDSQGSAYLLYRGWSVLCVETTGLKYPGPKVLGQSQQHGR